MWPKYSLKFFKAPPGAVSFFTHFSASALGHVAGALIIKHIKDDDKEYKGISNKK